MISVLEYEEALNDMVAYICPFCNKLVKWMLGVRLSPLTCPHCKKNLEDVSRIMARPEGRVKYHHA
jgi:hypothetical protein